MGLCGWALHWPLVLRLLRWPLWALGGAGWALAAKLCFSHQPGGTEVSKSGSITPGPLEEEADWPWAPAVGLLRGWPCAHHTRPILWHHFDPWPKRLCWASSGPMPEGFSPGRLWKESVPEDGKNAQQGQFEWACWHSVEATLWSGDSARERWWWTSSPP